MKTQAERMEIAKKEVLNLLNLEDFDQCGDWRFAILREIDNQEQWVTVELKARKKFDIDEEIESWNFQVNERALKALEKEKKKNKKS